MVRENYSYSPPLAGSQRGGWTGFSSSVARFMSISFLTSVLSNPYLYDSIKLFIMGSILETGRRFCQWLMERVHFQYAITAQFEEGDQAYEWIVLFLTENGIWRRSKEFKVTAKSSKRQWSVQAGEDTTSDSSRDNAEYVPTYQLPQLFRWNGYFVEIKRDSYNGMMLPGSRNPSTFYLKIYTRNMKVISQLVEEARRRYIDVSRPNVIIHTADNSQYNPGFTWNNVKRKTRRPLNSIVLQEGVMNSLIQDALEFLGMEDWYLEAGIPYRRGYLLHGPPGTGKSSTIYALAGELGLEIYSLSLASGYVDDMYLQRAVSSIPKKAIFLIEDIDCAFPSPREDDDDGRPDTHGYTGMVTPDPYGGGRKSAVTLSGLLNVLDGVGSEEGKLFFATTNYLDNLDAALIRPGRIDKKISYSLATKAQAEELFIRFFPIAHVDLRGGSAAPAEKKTSKINELAGQFANEVPEHEFSTAELQGYLLGHKRLPEDAAENVSEWIRKERSDRAQQRLREETRKKKTKELKERRDTEMLAAPLARMGILPMGMGTPVQPTNTSTPATTDIALACEPRHGIVSEENKGTNSLDLLQTSDSSKDDDISSSSRPSLNTGE